MKKIQKYKNSKLSQIDCEDFNFSQIGDASAKRYLYLLDKKKNIDNLNKKQTKNNSQELLIENKDIYDNIYQKGEYQEDIFDKAYDAKLKKEKEEKRQKNELPKKSCALIDEMIKVNQKIKSEINKNKNKKIFKKLKEEVKQQKKDMEMQLTSELEKERYKYHLIHHHHDLFTYKSLTNLHDKVSSNTYKPKLEYIFKKIIYSPEFNKMTGRNDKENKKEKIEDKINIIIKTQKEKELENYQKKIKKIRNLGLIPSTKNEETLIDTQDKKPLRRHTSIENNLVPNKNILFRKNSLDNDEYVSESRNFTKKIIRRNNSGLMNPKFLIFKIRNNQNNKHSIASIENIEEEYTDNNDTTNDYKKNISNNLDENTLSSANHHKTTKTSGRKKQSSHETEVIYPNLSKNESNIIINNNYNLSYPKSLGSQRVYNSLNNLDYLINQKINEQNFSNNSLNEFNAYKQNRINTILSSLKKDTLPSNKVVNFQKMLPRYHFNKTTEQDKSIYSNLSPNYDAIKPKCIMKVIYRQKHYFKKNKTKEFKSDFNEIVFDINKSYNNYNNHFPTKNIYLGKMTGRKNDKALPSYMIDQYNRNAFNTFSDKSLKMNNFANGELLEQKSSFNQKRTFNYKLNEQYTGNDPNGLDNDLNNLFRKITKYPINNKYYSYAESKAFFGSNSDAINKNRYHNFINQTLSRSKMPEYYQVNLDKFGRYPFSSGEKIDGFTLKTIKSSRSAIDLLTAHEKKIFLFKNE